MQENEFEKQVRELMDAFKLSPSESAWGKIETQIIKQKRKRRWIVLFFLVAALMAGGYFIYNERGGGSAVLNKKEMVKNEKALNEKKSDETTLNEKTSNENSVAIDKKKNEDSAGNSITVKQQHFAAGNKLKEKNQTAIKRNSEEKNITTLSERVYEEQNRVVEDKLKSSADNSSKIKIAADKKAAENNLKDKEQSEQAKEEIQKEIEEKNDNSDTLNKSDTQNKNVIALNEDANKLHDTISKIADKQFLKDSAVVKKEIKKSETKATYSKKLQWGITLFYGRSDVFESLLGIKSFFGIDFDKSADGAFPSAQGGGSYNADSMLSVVSSKRSQSKGAFSFGVDFKKPLSRKSSLIAGLHYARLKTSIETGSLKDSAASFRYDALTGAPVTILENFYTPGRGNIYINHYSFLQIPVTYEYGIGKNNIVSLNAGLSLNRLTESNALLYDSYNRAYYSNKSLLRKTQVNFIAGVNVKLALNKTTTVYLGPQFQYSLSNLSKYSKYDNQHLFTCGLKASVFFHR